ncbi:hypothetical protein [Pseudonocardia sp. ICBG1293]|uniref:hypothetical protein n=1 Tax=Pseudonocardia sp. ICBG1293 TaxID=2844382 RepID=UPI001CC9BE9C|nr:hypothetical protein [Pseudonocardia sp. ICBG1293]
MVAASTGEILDDAQGRGYKTAHDAYRAYTYKSLAPPKRHVVKRKVTTWCAEHEALIADAKNMAFHAAQDGEPLTTADVERLLFEHGVLELPFTVRDLMRHW